ncbi:hypothetical protein [Limnohabitans sp. Rim8]|uniref:hypothetical protein n=1 Tax=Limnohabitans sp. Rim8 TaxID=1100718 RepID=UPI0025DCEE9A|nr:hypothetical protein [Limnohabitans sp. Rim8]
MSLYEENKKPMLSKAPAEFQKHIKVLTNLFIVYTILVIIYNTIMLVGSNPINSTHFSSGYLLGAAVILISAIYLVKPKSVYIFLIALIYLICSLFVLPLKIIGGFVDTDSVILWTNPLWFFTFITENIDLDIPIKIFFFLQYFPAAVIFIILFFMSLKNKVHNN